MASALDWTVVRPGGLTDDPGTGKVDVSTEMGRRKNIPREDVAASSPRAWTPPRRSASRSRRSRATRTSSSPSERSRDRRAERWLPSRPRAERRRAAPACPRASRSSTTSTRSRRCIHPLRMRAYVEAVKGPVSAKELADRLGVPLQRMSYHVRLLAEAGLLEVVRKTPRRGAIETHYRAIATLEVDDEALTRLARAPEGVDADDPAARRRGRGARRRAGRAAPAPTSSSPARTSRSTPPATSASAGDPRLLRPHGRARGGAARRAGGEARTRSTSRWWSTRASASRAATARYQPDLGPTGRRSRRSSASRRARAPARAPSDVRRPTPSERIAFGPTSIAPSATASSVPAPATAMVTRASVSDGQRTAEDEAEAGRGGDEASMRPATCAWNAPRSPPGRR